jgi:hypothetical protein
VITPNVIHVILSLVIGWAALWPARRGLGPIAYHLGALPAGLLGWALVPSLTMAAGLDYTLATVGVGLGVYVASVALIAHRAYAGGDSGGCEVPWWSYGVHLALILMLSLKVADVGISTYSRDSWGGYVKDGYWLFETGRLVAQMVADRNILLPSILAGGAVLGAEWTYVLFPVAGAHVLAWTGYAAASVAFSGMSRAWQVVGAIASAALLGSTAAFLFHSIYVHSHMLSALYFMVAIVAVLRATPPDDTGVSRPWLLLSSLAALGFALMRPDGIAYVLVVVAVLFVRLLAAGSSAKDLIAWYSPVVGMLIVQFAVLFARYGLWEIGRMTGRIALTFVVGHAAVAVVGSWALELARRTHTAERLSRFAPIAGAMLGLSALMLVSQSDPDGFAEMFDSLSMNAFSLGGWGSFWWFAPGVVAVLALFPVLRGTRREVPDLLLGLVAFLAIALIVHGTSHHGRYGWGDSLNRVLFHITPLVALAWSLLAAGVAKLWLEESTTADADVTSRSGSAHACPPPSRKPIVHSSPRGPERTP